MENLFVYGTLRDKPVQKKLLGRTLDLSKYTLLGYKKIWSTVKRKRYPFIIPEKGHMVHGFVARVSQKELSILDRYEGKSYERKPVKLHSGVRAFTYLGAPRKR